MRGLRHSAILLLLLAARLPAAEAPCRLLAGPYLTRLGPDRVTVSWETGEPATGRVECSTRPGEQRFADAMPAARLHRVTLADLPPATECSYRVHVGDEATPFYRFTTAPAGPAPFRFAAYGDSRSNPKYHARVAAALREHRPAFVVHTGDFVTDGLRWKQWPDQFFGPAAALLRECPLVPAMGTHDRNAPAYCDYFGFSRESSWLEQLLGRATSAPPDPTWFAWSYGDVEFFIINSYASLKPGSPQLAWLEKALPSSRARWKIAVLHQTLYSSGRHGGSETLRRTLLPLFLKHGVDLVLAGHEHLYERTVAIRDSTAPSSRALVEIVTGGGGASLHKVTPGPWTAYAASTRNFCIVEVEGDRLAVTAYDDAGDPFDCTLLAKGDGRREFGAALSAEALEFLHCARQFASFSFPAIRGAARSREFTLTVRNSSASELQGDLAWEIRNRAWTIAPPRLSLRVPPGGKATATFKVTVNPSAYGAPVDPVPQAVLTSDGCSTAVPAFVIEKPSRSRTEKAPGAPES